MYLGLYSCPPPGKAVDPRTPDKRDAKRRRHATCEDQAAAAALAALANGPGPGATEQPPAPARQLTYKRRLCFAVADHPPAVVAAMLVHQLGTGRPFEVVSQALDAPAPLRGSRPVPISERAAEFVRVGVRDCGDRIMFTDFAAPDTPPELNDIFEALQKSGNLTAKAV